MRAFQKFKTAAAILVLNVFGLGILSLAPVGNMSLLVPSALADSASASQTDACKGLTELDSTQDCGTKGSGFTDLVGTIVSIISYIVGIVAIIMVIVAAMKYITSGGDSNKVSSAKSTLIYALIGIAIAGAAQALVHFALSTASNSVH